MSTAHRNAFPASEGAPRATYPASARVARFLIAYLEELLTKIERTITRCEVVGVSTWRLEALASRVNRGVMRLEVVAASWPSLTGRRGASRSD
jgi:hypothetical protein